MKCLDEGLIQKYIDQETTLLENEQIKAHLSSCRKCAKEINEMQEIAVRMKYLIGSSSNEEVKIPAFKMPVQRQKPKYRHFKKIVYAAAAACLLGIFLVIQQHDKKEVAIVYSYDLENEYNANLPLSEQEMVIQVFDAEGKLIP